MLDRLAKQPVQVKVKDPKSGKPVTVELTRSAAADALRFALYSPDKASQVPLRVHLAAQGDYRVLAQTAVLLRANLQKGLAWGDLFSVSCAEDLTFIDSSGLHVLVDAKAWLEAEHRRLAIVNRPRVLTRVLDLTGLTEHFD